MLEYHFRNRLQPFVNQVARTLLRCKLSAGDITAAALLTGALSGLSLMYHHPYLACILMWSSGLFDMLDGTMARLNKTASKLGSFCDLITDRTVEAILILGFYFWRPQFALSYIIFLIAVLLHFSTFVLASSIFENAGEKSIHYEQSIIERSEAFVVFTTMMLFPHHINIFLGVLNTAILLCALARFQRMSQIDQ